MGMYVYTLRKKTRKLQGVDAHYFGYAYKPSWSWSWNNERRHKAMMDRYDAAGDAAFEAYEGGPVIVADPGDKDLNGCRVYRNVRSGRWNDCNEFPGEAIGFVKQEGRKLTLVSEHRWRATMPNDRTFVEYVKDGKFTQRVEMDDARLDQTTVPA